MGISIIEIIQYLLQGCMFTIVFSIGLKANKKSITYLLHRPWLLMRSILAMYIVTPLIAFLLITIFNAPFRIEIAVLLMVISAGAPALPKKLLKLGTNADYVYSLAVIMALISIVTVPVSLAVLSMIFPLEASLPFSAIASKIGSVFLVPLFIGMLFRYFIPVLAGRLYEPLITTASFILLALVGLIISTCYSDILGIGFIAFFLIVMVTIASLVVGHLLGGPNPHDRTTLAVACATRFPALGLLVASMNFPGAKPMPIVITYILTSSLTVIPYMQWRKKQDDQK